MLRISAHIRRFSPQHRSRRKLPFPAAPNLRLAQISPVAPVFDSAQSFSPDRWHELESYRPRALMGIASDLQRLAKQAELGVRDLTSVDYALFVLTECGHTPVSDVFKVVLWQTFGVPLYELYVGSGGMLLACECEAHEGWHIEPGTSFAVKGHELILEMPGSKPLHTGLAAKVEPDLCPCGRAGLRLMDIEALATPDRRELAATA